MVRSQKTALWKALSGVFLTVALAMTPALAQATPTDTAAFNDRAEEVFAESLSALIQEQGVAMEIGEVQIDAPAATVAQYRGNADDYASDLVAAYREDAPSSDGGGITVQPYGTANYTSAVFSGVPAGGACWIHQDFRATVTNYKVTSKTLKGSSYQTGVCVFQWSANYSWFEGNLNVLSKGTYHAVIKGGPISFAATFKAIYKVNKSSLKQNVQ